MYVASDSFGFFIRRMSYIQVFTTLAESGDNEELIERVILFGTPILRKAEEWENARKMVVGRFVNVYSDNDWILRVTFCASLLTQGLAEIQAVNILGS